MRLQVEEAERILDYNKAAELRYGKLDSLEKQLEAANTSMNGGETDKKRLVKEEVGPDDVAEIIARWSGIPVSRLMEGEREKLMRLADILHKRVIGQDQAIQAVADAVLRARAGLKDPRRPIGSFIFLGPTGVGKTELCKTLAQALFDTEENMIRLDMSEYMEKHTVARLIGAPPGYIGHDQGGQLTEAVRRKPFSVILFDEVEKAHPDVFNALLQILDDGRLTDSKGRTVDFKNTIIIMTSNIGALLLLEGISEQGFQEGVQDAVLNELKKHFRPEFLNRVDETVLFEPLNFAQIKAIIDLRIEELQTRLEEQNIALSLSEAAKDFIAKEAYNPVYGARPLKRYIQQHIETPLAKQLISGKIADGTTLHIDASEHGLTFN